MFDLIRWIRSQQIANILRAPHNHANPSGRYFSMKEQDVRRESLFQQSIQNQKNSADLLEKKFQEAEKKAKEQRQKAGEEGQPPPKK